MTLDFDHAIGYLDFEGPAADEHAPLARLNTTKKKCQHTA